VQALFTAPKTAAASPLAEQLGCAFEDGMTGPHVKVDELKQTSVGGVFAAGDLATGMHNATLAAAAGVMAGIAAHRSLVFEP
jgi:thioredoxin reductase